MSAKGHRWTPAQRAAWSEKCKAKPPFTDEHRARLSEAHKGNTSAVGATRTPEVRAVLREKSRGNTTRRGTKLSPEARARVSAAVKAMWQRPEYRERMTRHLSSIRRDQSHAPTRIEARLGAILREAFPGEVLVYEHPVPPYFIDWALPALGLAYEADGSYWHNRPGVAEFDRRRDAYLASLGWTVVRYKEEELA